LRGQPMKKLGRASLPKTGGAHDPVEAALEAWKRLKAASKSSFDDWVLIGQALLIGKHYALIEANKARPEGSKYNKAFNAWLKKHKLDDVDKADRAKLIHIVENLEKVEEWRAKLSDGERAKYNHPSTVWRAWECPNRGNRGEPHTCRSNGKVNGEPMTLPDGKTLTRVPGQKRWEGNLIVLARKVIGAEEDLSRMVLKPTEPGLKSLVQQAAAALTRIADKLSDASKPKVNSKTQPKVEEHMVAE
jgi:hypothetical protein